MRKVILLLSCLLIAAASVYSQAVITPEDLHLRVTKILLKKDLRVFADELAQTKGTDVDSLLLRLDVFERAGQKERIRQILKQLSETSDLPPIPERDWIFKIVRQKIAHDLAAQRIYYDRIVGDDGYYETNPFISLWQAEGDEKELDAWLAKRAVIGSSWFTVNLERSVRLGRIQSIFDELAEQVRQNPNDKKSLNIYLYAVRRAQEYSNALNHYLNAIKPAQDQIKLPNAFENETDWLESLFRPKTASDAYDLGLALDSVNPILAVKYYQESLAKPITPEEIRVLEQTYPIYTNGPQRRMDWEKQLRYWAKQKLAAAYQRTGRSTLAQPLIEELVGSKEDDVYTQDLYSLAGAVQGGSGARAVEAKVIQDGAVRFNSVDYWVDRIKYYEGRSEYEQVIQSAADCLAHIPTAEKARFVAWFDSFFDYPLSQPPDSRLLKAKIGETLIKEFKDTRLDSDLAFEIARAATGRGLGLNDVVDAMFERRQDVLIPLIEKRDLSDTEVRELVSDVLKHERISTGQKTFYFAELERLASDASAGHRLDIAAIFKDAGEHQRRIPLILYYLKKTPANSKNEWSRTSAMWDLFEAYRLTGRWQLAEKLLDENQKAFLGGWGNYLELLAICAGQQNASGDALRIWLKAVNFNGHSTFGLTNLADTPAKPLLREYYLQMKQREPTSPIPDAALKMLR